jgi:uncharacterized protein (DUF2344 family)
MIKRAYPGPHDFDEDAMPTPCTVCNGWFDLTDGSPNPRNEKEVICEGCAHDIQQVVDVEDEIEDQNELIQDAEYTIKYAKKRLEELTQELIKLTR